MKKLIICLWVICLNACCFSSPNAEFYMLNSDGLSPLSDRYFSISVPVVKVPEVLERPQMVTYSPEGNQVQILEFSRWGETLPYVLQNTLTNDLMAYLPNAYVKSSRYASEKMRYNVEVEVNNLKAFKGEKAELSVWWSIRNAAGENSRRRQGFYEAVVGDESMDALVRAQNEAVHQLSRDIAENFLEL